MFFKFYYLNSLFDVKGRENCLCKLTVIVKHTKFCPFLSLPNLRYKSIRLKIERVPVYYL